MDRAKRFGMWSGRAGQGRGMRRGIAAGLLGLMTGVGMAQGAPWTVKPEWIRAHEDFLASDVLAGRGSATRDEQIAATYVGSEFEAYGLQPAPGMKGYLQTAEVFAPELDGHAVFATGSLTVEEGSGLRLLSSSAETATGALVKVAADAPMPAQIAHGTVLVVSGSPDFKRLVEIYRAARKAQVAVLVVTEGGATEQMTEEFGGVTRVPKRLVEAPARPGLSIAVLGKNAMAQLGRMPAGQSVTLTVHAVAQPAKSTYNAIGYLKGSDPTSGTILLTAHLDHLGVGKPVNGDAIYNGANDDAAGTTAVLELAHALANGPKLRRSVLFVCYGSEEAGELGSEYFGRHSPVPLKELIANLEFEMIGVQDPKMPKDTLLLTGWERSDLGPMLKAHGAKLGPDPYPEQHFFERSDNYQLALEGVVAHTAAGYGTPSTYHQPDDDLAHLNLEFMRTAIQSLIEPVRWLAESDFRPAWKKDGQPHR